jgi:hypothetical protein
MHIMVQVAEDTLTGIHAAFRHYACKKWLHNSHHTYMLNYKMLQ